MQNSNWILLILQRNGIRHDLTDLNEKHHSDVCYELWVFLFRIQIQVQECFVNLFLLYIKLRAEMSEK